MKKLICAALALCLMIFPAICVSAEGESVATGVYVTGLTLPAAGESIPAHPLSGTKLKVLASVEGKDELEELTCTADGFWAEADHPDKALTEGSFITGRKYRICVTVEFSDPAPEIKSGETEFLINNTKATYRSNAGNKVLFSADFVATPGDFTPSVSLDTKGGKIRSYDGKATVLEATVESVEGVSYRYEWYRNDQLISGETGKSLSLKNVSDSGEYYCKVIASVPSVTSAGEKSTKTSSVEIDISPCLITVEIQDAKKNLFEADPEFTYKIVGDPADKLTGALTREAGEDIGSYTIQLGTLAFPKEVADNYEVLVTTGVLTILDIGDLPLVSVANLADQSYIVGKNDAKIIANVTKGALPADAVLSLTISDEGVRDAMEKKFSAKMLKGLAVKLTAANGSALSLPKYAVLQLLIPLSEEDAIYKPESIRAILYQEGAKNVTTEVTELEGVTYISVKLENLGNLILFQGQKVASGAVKESEPHEAPKEKEKSGSPWMWVIIITLSMCAVGAIVFTVVQTKKTATPTKTYVPVKHKVLTPEQQAEKERARRIADELNAMAPVPELDQNHPHESGLRTRPVQTSSEHSAPVGSSQKPASRPVNSTRPVTRNQSPSAQPPKGRKISFEDLED